MDERVYNENWFNLVFDKYPEVPCKPGLGANVLSCFSKLDFPPLVEIPISPFVRQQIDICQNDLFDDLKPRNTPFLLKSISDLPLLSHLLVPRITGLVSEIVSTNLVVSPLPMISDNEYSIIDSVRNIEPGVLSPSVPMPSLPASPVFASSSRQWEPP